jgi:hypothetical protein
VGVVRYTAHGLYRLVEEEYPLFCGYLAMRCRHDQCSVLPDDLHVYVFRLPIVPLRSWKTCDRRYLDGTRSIAESVDDLRQCSLFVSASVRAAEVRYLIFGKVLLVDGQPFGASSVDVLCRAQLR